MSAADSSRHIVASILAALLVACDPILLNQQALVMTETLAAFLAILALWSLARFDASRSWWNAGLAGGAISLAALCRPTFLPWLGLVAVGMLLVRAGNCGLRNADCGLEMQKKPKVSAILWRGANVVALVVGAAAVMSPWVIRNQRELGKPILTTTHGGYTLYLGNNSDFFRYVRTDGAKNLPWDPTREFGRQAIEATYHELAIGKTFPAPRTIRWEIQLDREYQYLALEQIRADPSGFARACCFRVRQLWSPFPFKLSAEESTGRKLLRHGTAAWYCGVYLLAAVGVWKLRWKLFRPPWIWGVLLCLAFTAVHTAYWCNLRMRAPLMPFVAIVASAAVGCVKRT